MRAHGVTIFLTTHYLEEAELLADRVGIIRKGKLVVEGTIDELRHRIQSARGIAVRLSNNYSKDEITERMQTLKAQLPVQSLYDTVRNTINIMPPENMTLNSCLRQVLSWLETEDLNYSSLSTAEPSLEELYLTLSEGVGRNNSEQPKAGASATVSR